MSERKCIHCNQPNGKGPRELRPYGPGGKDVCAECTFRGPPEREKAAKRQFLKQLDAAGQDAVLTNEGPKPLAGGKRGKA